MECSFARNSLPHKNKLKKQKKVDTFSIKYRPSILVLVIFVVVVSLGITLWQNQKQSDPKADPAQAELVEVPARIVRVLPSGRGIKMSTLLTLRYEYAGQEFSATRRFEGYRKGLYDVGDTIRISINPNSKNEVE